MIDTLGTDFRQLAVCDPGQGLSSMSHVDFMSGFTGVAIFALAYIILKRRDMVSIEGESLTGKDLHEENKARKWGDRVFFFLHCTTVVQHNPPPHHAAHERVLLHIPHVHRQYGVIGRSAWDNTSSAATSNTVHLHRTPNSPQYYLFIDPERPTGGFLCTVIARTTYSVTCVSDTMPERDSDVLESLTTRATVTINHIITF